MNKHGFLNLLFEQRIQNAFSLWPSATFLSALCLIFLFSCNNAEPIDLTENVVGTYDGIASLYLDTDSTVDIDNQQIEITRIDDEHIQFTTTNYPSQSPASGQSFTALLTRTPFGFIRTPGVMLTIESLSNTEANINGTPYLVQGGEREAHGRFNAETGELIFALEVERNGVFDYEIFVGVRK